MRARWQGDSAAAMPRLAPEVPSGPTDIGDLDTRKRTPACPRVHSRSDPAYDSRCRATTDCLPYNCGRRTGHLRHWQGYRELREEEHALMAAACRTRRSRSSVGRGFRPEMEVTL